MNITRNLIVAVLMTVVTTLLLGVVYPLVITGIAQVAVPDQANGQLIERDGRWSDRASSARGFRRRDISGPRPSAAGIGYDAANSAGSQLGPTNKKLIEHGQGERRGGAAGESRTRRCRSISLRRRPPGSTRTCRPRRPTSRCLAWRGNAACPKRDVRALVAGAHRGPSARVPRRTTGQRAGAESRARRRATRSTSAKR